MIRIFSADNREPLVIATDKKISDENSIKTKSELAQEIGESSDPKKKITLLRTTANENVQNDVGLRLVSASENQEARSRMVLLSEAERTIDDTTFGQKGSLLNFLNKLFADRSIDTSKINVIDKSPEKAADSKNQIAFAAYTKFLPKLPEKTVRDRDLLDTEAMTTRAANFPSAETYPDISRKIVFDQQAVA